MKLSHISNDLQEIVNRAVRNKDQGNIPFAVIHNLAVAQKLVEDTNAIISKDRDIRLNWTLANEEAVRSQEKLQTEGVSDLLDELIWMAEKRQLTSYHLYYRLQDEDSVKEEIAEWTERMDKLTHSLIG